MKKHLNILLIMIFIAMIGTLCGCASTAKNNSSVQNADFADDEFGSDDFDLLEALRANLD